MSGRGDEGLFLRCLKPLDEHVSVKWLLRVWAPRFEVLVRTLLVATFLDDSFRVAAHFSEHTTQVGEEGFLKPLAATSPALVDATAAVVLSVGLLAQSLGSLCLIAHRQPDGAAKALIGWAMVQPVLYMQLANAEFVTGSLSIVGGLLIIRAHLSEQERVGERRVPAGGGGLRAPDGAERAAIARTQLLGRLLLPAVYLHRALVLLGDLAHHHHSLPTFAIDAAVLVGLVLGCALVAAGLKSRAVALALALTNLGFVVYQHVFFRFLTHDGGVWKYDEVELRKSVPRVALPEDMSVSDFEPWHLFDLHRYYFFQGLSTAGALLLLAQFGPGEIAVEEDEVLLGDVQRARDYQRVQTTA